MQLLDGKVLEDDPDLASIVRENPSQGVVKVPADRALKVGVFHDCYWCLGIAKGRRVGHPDLRQVLGQRVLGHVRHVATK